MKKSGKAEISPMTVIFLMFILVFTTLIVFAVNVVSYRPQKAEEMTGPSDDGRYNFLVLGKDKVASLTDIILLFSIDTENHEAFILQIPRDTYLDYTDKNYKKINGALAAYGDEKVLSEKLSEYFSLTIDHYVSLDIEAFENIVDMLGGVEVNVPADMDYDDPEQGLSVHIKSGRQTLDGKSAMGFVRYRKGYLMGDIARIDAQKIFAAALAEKIMNEKNPMTLYNILVNVKKEVKTDICDRDVLYFAYNFLLCPENKIFIATLPGESERSEISGAWYYIISRQGCAELLSERFGLECGEKDFDKNENFVDTETKSFYDIYNKFYGYRLYRVDEIGRNGIELT